MASLHRIIPIDASSDRVWALVRDFGAVHLLVPGFVVDCRLDGDARIVTFASGNVLRELLVDCDDPLAVHKFCSMLPAFQMEARPVIAVQDAVRVELEAMAWRDGLKGK